VLTCQGGVLYNDEVLKSLPKTVSALGRKQEIVLTEEKLSKSFVSL